MQRSRAESALLLTLSRQMEDCQEKKKRRKKKKKKKKAIMLQHWGRCFKLPQSLPACSFVHDREVFFICCHLIFSTAYKWNLSVTWSGIFYHPELNDTEISLHGTVLFGCAETKMERRAWSADLSLDAIIKLILKMIKGNLISKDLRNLVSTDRKKKDGKKYSRVIWTRKNSEIN